MPNLLILTVGTGTAGKHSDLASGLKHTIELLAPRQFWLVPSTAPDSLTIAELVAENQLAYQGRFPLERPDDLESCRQHIRDVIARANSALQPGERLLVNPTSGTKQMTAAATLAALDELIGDIVFTTGERADGVVITGTERITAFDPADFFRERDLKLAREFFDAGDFYAAERVLKPHNAKLTREYATAFTCHHWRRFDYDNAKRYGQSFGIVSADRRHRDIIADILAWSGHALRHHDPDTSVRLTYKGLEHAARFFLKEETGLAPDERGRYAATAVSDLRTSYVPDRDKPRISLGLQAIVKILTDLGHPFGTGFDSSLYQLSNIRNEGAHDIRPADMSEAQSYLDRATTLVGIAPTSLPQHL